MEEQERLQRQQQEDELEAKHILAQSLADMHSGTSSVGIRSSTQREHQPGRHNSHGISIWNGPDEDKGCETHWCNLKKLC